MDLVSLETTFKVRFKFVQLAYLNDNVGNKIFYNQFGLRVKCKLYQLDVSEGKPRTKPDCGYSGYSIVKASNHPIWPPNNNGGHSVYCKFCNAKLKWNVQYIFGKQLWISFRKDPLMTWWPYLSPLSKNKNLPELCFFQLYKLAYRSRYGHFIILDDAPCQRASSLKCIHPKYIMIMWRAFVCGF